MTLSARASVVLHTGRCRQVQVEKKMSVGGVEELYKNYGILADAGDNVAEVRELPDSLWFTWKYLLMNFFYPLLVTYRFPLG